MAVVGATLAVALHGAGASPAPTGWVVPEPGRVNLDPTLGDVVGTFKSLVFKVYLGWVEAYDPTRHARFWQRNYYEHIIRNERELQAIRRYILRNPTNWQMDRDNLDNTHRLLPPTTVDEYVCEAMVSHE